MSVTQYKDKNSSKSIFEVECDQWGDKLIKVKLAFIDIVKNDDSYSRYFLDDSLSSLQPDIIRDCDCTDKATLLIVKYDHFVDYAELIPKVEELILEAFQ